MSGINNIIHSAISDFKKEIENTVEQNCKTFCVDLLRVAIEERQYAPKKDNMTGNFVNSIVVCLYKKGKPLEAYYAAGKVKGARMRKMTFPKAYYFNSDNSGIMHKFVAPCITDEGWGYEDAKMFFSSYKPDGNNMFDIVVAYPVEYASFIESQRGTAGYFRTLHYAKQVGFKFLKI